MRYCLALDLQRDAALIAEYEQWHRGIWPEIRASILEGGITEMEIYRLEDRLIMIMETVEGFNFEKKAAMDAANPAVQRWEELMWKYQVAIKPLEAARPKDNNETIAGNAPDSKQDIPGNEPGGRRGEKWRLMDKIFSLGDSK
jgi:L-rhamnose mutarotase